MASELRLCLFWSHPFRSAKETVEGSEADAQLSGCSTLAQYASVDRCSNLGELARHMWALASGRASNPSTSPSSVGHPFLDALGYQASFEFSHCSEDGE